MPSLATSLESLLVFVAIVAISALSNWLKQRKQQQELERQPRESGPAPSTMDGPPSRRQVVPRTEAPPPKPIDWQEELRRLLEGDQPDQGGSPLPNSTSHRPAEVAKPPPVEVARPAPTVRAMPLPRGTHFPDAAERLDQLEAPSFQLAQLAPLTEAAQAYERGSRVQVEASSRLHQAVQRTAAATPEPAQLRSGRPASPEAVRLLAQLRHPRGARQAILASLVFSPPRALEGLK